MAGKFEIKKTNTGFVFQLKARNGEVIAVSEVYQALASCKNGIESVTVNAPKAAIEDQTIENYEKATNPKFEIYMDKAGEYRFRLKARNGEIIATGEGYQAKSSCLNGIESVKKNVEGAKVVELE